MNLIEVWKDIPGYEDEYQASTLGNIRSIKSNNLILKGDFQPNGYKRVYLWKNGSKKICSFTDWWLFLFCLIQITMRK